MSAWINKYRPTKFEQVRGHGAQITALEKALGKGRAHTFLFTGPAGVGKTTLARLTAKTAGCSNADIVEVDAATNTGIDAMRVISEGMSYSPIGGKSKAIIVDEVHALSKQAFQSLLKSLEEPPEWGYWMLCTTEPTKVPAAIKSRCFHVNLRPLPKGTLVDLLKQIAQQEKLKGKHLSEIINLCAEAADGSPRQAISNFAAAAEANSVDEASELIAAAESGSLAIDLARKLVGDWKWPDIAPILNGLKDQDPEGVRQVVRAYFTAIALKQTQGKILWKSIQVLGEFSQPFNSRDGVTPVMLACARLLDR